MERQSAITATALEIRYIEAPINHKTGIKGPSHKQRKYLDRERVLSGSSGTFVTTPGSHFILFVKIGDKIYGVRIGGIFKDLLRFKLLSPKRRGKIADAMPPQVEVSEKKDTAGNKYYALTDICAKGWADQVRV